MAENTAKQMDDLLDAEGRRRRKDRPVVKEERHPLETVPFFDRPLGALPTDIQVGQDELGNPVFQSGIGGYEYVIRKNPDQRNFRQKFQDDIFPAIEEYFKDPTLPTKEQVVGAGKAVAESIIDTASIPGDLLTGKRNLGNLTYADVADTAGMMAMGSIPFEVPEGAVRIFGGASAKKLDIKNFAKAEKLYEDGLDPESIRKETGWFKDDVDRKWRFEIDDSKLKLTGEDYPGVDFSDSSGPDAWYNYVDEINENRLDDYYVMGGMGTDPHAVLKLKDFLQHPKLYKHYPQLKDYTIEIGVDDMNLDGAIGTFDPSTKTIQLSSQIQDLDELKDILVHEVQHAVQDIEGFLPGSNVAESTYLATSKFADEAKDISKTLKSYGYEVTKENLDDPDFLRNASYYLENQNPNLSDAQEYSALKYLKRLEDLGQRMSDVTAFKYHYYRNRSGEIEADLVEKRRSFDEEQRKLYSPISGKQGQITRPQAYRTADSVVQARQGQSDILLDTVNFDYVPSKDNPSRYVYQYKDKQSGNYGELYNEAIRDFLKGNKDTKKLARLKTGDTVTLNSDGREYFFVEFRPYSEMIRKLDTNYPHVFHETMGNRIENDSVAGVTLVRIPRGTTKKQRKEIIDYIKNPPAETIDGLNLGPKQSVPENFTKFKEFSLGDLIFNSNKSTAKPEATASFRDTSDTDSGFLNKFKFAEGGVTMKDQMEMAFMQEGGLKDDGMDRDPVSGNEIPPGSMASEVRDDIPAQLSEGEYVVPADVVQYFGVKFFEDLRMDAKRGLADMESNGRIGGEPMDMPMDMPMNQGGMMQTREQTIPTDTGVAYNVGGMTSNLYNNPTRMDQQVNAVSSNMGNNPQGMDMQNRTQAMMTPEQMDQVNPPPPPRGFNPGGLTGNEAAAYNYITSPTMPNPMYQTPGASYMYAAPPQLTTTAQETTPSVEYCDKVGMDYDPITKMCIPRPIEQAAQGGGDNDDPGTNLPEVDPDKWMEDFDYSGTDEGMQNLLQQSSDLLDPPERTGLGGAVAGLLDKGIFGKFNAGSNAAKVAANIIILDHYGVDTTALTNKWKSYTNENLSGVPKGFYNGDSFAKQAAIKHGLSLGRGAVDPFENPIFKSKEDYRKFLENDERKENIRSRYSKMDISPLKSTGKKLTEKQKRDAKSDAGLAEAAKIIARQGDDGPTAAQKAAARKRGDEISKQQKQKLIDSGQTVDMSQGLDKALEKMKEEGTFNYGGRNKGGLMKKKKK